MFQDIGTIVASVAALAAVMTAIVAARQYFTTLHLFQTKQRQNDLMNRLAGLVADLCDYQKTLAVVLKKRGDTRQADKPTLTPQHLAHTRQSAASLYKLLGEADRIGLRNDLMGLHPSGSLTKTRILWGEFRAGLKRIAELPKGSDMSSYGSDNNYIFGIVRLASQIKIYNPRVLPKSIGWWSWILVDRTMLEQVNRVSWEAEIDDVLQGKGTSVVLAGMWTYLWPEIEDPPDVTQIR